MFQKDYVMRMIQQFTVALAKIIRLRTSEQIDEANQELTGALYSLTGLSESTIESLSYRDLISLVCGVDKTSPEKCFILAELIKAKADIYLSKGDQANSFKLYLKSFNIYVETTLSSDSSNLKPNLGTIDEIINRIEPFQIPYETQKLLFKYYESVEKYGKAEDVLFEMIHDDTQRNITVAEGAAFYGRLRLKSPEQLEKGNLPMDEVQEGMEKFFALTAMR